MPDLNAHLKSVGGKAPGRSLRRYIDLQNKFADHTGNTSIMIYSGLCDIDDPSPTCLPPLWAFQVYVTNGLTAETAEDMPVRLLHSIKPGFDGGGYFRLDIHFQPGISVDECIKHYRAEKATRSEKDLHVLPTFGAGDVGNTWMSFAVIVEKRDWEQEGVTIATFDPTERVLSYPVDEIEHREPDDLLIKHAQIKVEQPADSQSRGPYNGELASYCEDWYYTSSLREEYEERYQEEVEKGRKEW